MGDGQKHSIWAHGLALDQHARFFRLTSSVPFCILISLLIMLVLTFAVNVFNVPNPNMILISGLVVSSALLGIPGGVTGAVVMMTYTLWFFSTGHDFATFTDQNIQKVIVSAIGISVVAFFVSALRYIVSRTLRQLQHVNDMLEEDNRLLEGVSVTDVLTNTHNRYALRRGFSSYLGKNLHTMMLDIDDFKNTNDRYGHQAGDAVLAQVGAHLTEIYGHAHVYRFGGDEFLVMCPYATEGEFAIKCEKLRAAMASIHVEGMDEPVHFSAGYVYGTAPKESDLRLMIRQADSNLYNSKNTGKNHIVGCAFSRSIAESTQTHRNVAAGSFVSAPHTA